MDDAIQKLEKLGIVSQVRFISSFQTMSNISNSSMITGLCQIDLKSLVCIFHKFRIVVEIVHV